MSDALVKIEDFEEFMAENFSKKLQTLNANIDDCRRVSASASQGFAEIDIEINKLK